MIALLFCELRKVWGNRLFALLLAALAAGNLFLLAINTRPLEGHPGPEAYKAAGQAMAGMTMAQKGEFLGTKLEEAQGLAAIDSYYKGDYWTTPADYRRQYADAFAAYEQRYKDGDYTFFTGNPAAESHLFQQLWEEYESTAHYADFLRQVQNQAAQLAGISIFQQSPSSGYNAQVLQATARAYAGLEKTELCYYPQQGVLAALEAPFTDLFLLAAMLVLALFLVRQERDSGLLQLLGSLPGGRLHTAAAKLAAFGVSLLAVTALLYGANLGYCSLAFGLGPLDRTIQSLPALQRCTLQVSLASYLGLFTAAKWAGALVMGLWVMLAAAAARHPLGAWAGALALPAAMYGIRAAVPAAGNLNVLKYANLASFLQTNELLGRYRCLYWFGRPVSLPLVEWTAAGALGMAFAAGFCLLFARGRLSAGQKPQLPVLRRNCRPVSVWREEGRKLWLGQGAAAALAVFAAFCIWQGAAGRSYLTAEQLFYAEYMKTVSGPYTEESREILLEMGRAFGEESAANAGQIPADRTLQAAVYRNIVSEKVNRYLPAHPGAWLVYEDGWQKLFGFSGTGNLADTLYAGLLCAVCFCGLFAAEEPRGMGVLLRCTPLGRGRTAKAKLLHSAVLAALIALIGCLPHLWQAVRDYGLPALGAPAFSLSAFGYLPRWVTLGHLLAFWLACRTTACICMAFGTLWLGYRLKNALAAGLLAATVCCLPALLALAGLEGGVEWLGCWPLFHGTALAAILPGQPLSCLWAVAVLLAAAVAWIFYTAQDLCLAYEYGL